MAGSTELSIKSDGNLLSKEVTCNGGEVADGLLVLAD